MTNKDNDMRDVLLLVAEFAKKAGCAEVKAASEPGGNGVCLEFFVEGEFSFLFVIKNPPPEIKMLVAAYGAKAS